ncbi:MAG: AI-2E family transporter [Chitinispirillales bacterium]|jgi:predicted PurR-regulated permease PerM|nr:AI-2E family transporter [Chitinispirillales bacterium]
MVKKYTDWLVRGLIIVGLLYVGKPVLMPLVLAVFIWYLISILTDVIAKPRKWNPVRVPRPIAFTFALLVIFGAMALASWIIMTNITHVAAVIPAYQYNLEQMSRRVLSMVPFTEPLTFKKLLADVDFSSMTRGAVREVTSAFGKGAYVIIYLIFLFMEQRSFDKKFKKLLPKSGGDEVNAIIARINSDIRTYIGIKTLASFVTAAAGYIVFASVGLNFASFWTFLLFVLNYIPILGSIVATALPAVFALMQYESLAPFFVVLFGIVIIQQAVGSIIEPRFMGDKLNLSPLVILLSLATWNLIWGIPGMLMCVPLTAIVVIIFTYFPQTRPIAVALSRNGDIRGVGAMRDGPAQEEQEGQEDQDQSRNPLKPDTNEMTKSQG